MNSGRRSGRRRPEAIAGNEKPGAVRRVDFRGHGATRIFAAAEAKSI
jgi:hypothetical protein